VDWERGVTTGKEAESDRSAVEGHFRRKGLRWDEDYFLDQLSSLHKHDVYWAVIALREFGTEKSVAPLKALLYHPMQDVKATSILTIARISGGRETPFYAQALLDPAYPMKAYAMWAIADSADERAVDAVLQYFKVNRSKLKNGKINREALGLGVRYLKRFCDSRPDVSEFLDNLAITWDLDAVAQPWATVGAKPVQST
jgi:ribosomal protein L7/L12